MQCWNSAEAVSPRALLLALPETTPTSEIFHPSERTEQNNRIAWSEGAQDISLLNAKM